ncbi:hypothetical protein ASG92_14070 [Arthrobacter sp. Soil736]|uniref:Wadjet anti-phage system protein JetD domain-containing protein n=1 Tax=Arthrobacter sp. Soil736 TaxID=1736395 RepID=UPI0006F3AA6F|nr:Wadjet anti-phage system protein JetD domain-containing protein [Arthrobacter sp. Soil736]KRE67755.1 hypothetical protein ASG92_14070 [Arthrobacter sp. Soil736]
MITVAQARDTARARLQAKLGEWGSAGDRASTGALLSIALKPPTEREMLNDEAAAENWAKDWAALPLGNGATVDWEVRAWRSIGRQRVPVRLRLATLDDVAEFAGGEPARAWSRLRTRAAILRERFGDTDPINTVIRRHTETLIQFDESRFATVVEAVAWLVRHPVTGLRPRQLPIRGVDTKWFTAHRSIVSSLYAATTASTDLGIVNTDKLVRVRVLDEALAIGGIIDFAAPVSQLNVLSFSPAAVLVYENLETILAMPLWPDAIAVHGSGYAVDVVGRLPWVQQSPILYWGDLDSNGFAILHRLRSSHPDVTSVLMDESTLLDHRDLWVQEPTPNRGTFDTLTGSEQRALKRLRDEGDVRLEQERIPWQTALKSLQTAWEMIAERSQWKINSD